MFFDLLNIKTPAWYQTFIDGRRLTSMKFQKVVISNLIILLVYRKSRDAVENQQERPEERPHHTLKLTDQYLSLLVAILTHAGLCQVRAIVSYLLLTTNNVRRLLPCWKNRPPGLIYLARRLFSWPKYWQWQIECFLYLWRRRYRQSRKYFVWRLIISMARIELLGLLLYRP